MLIRIKVVVIVNTYKMMNHVRISSLIFSGLPFNFSYWITNFLRFSRSPRPEVPGTLGTPSRTLRRFTPYYSVLGISKNIIFRFFRRVRSARIRSRFYLKRKTLSLARYASMDADGNRTMRVTMKKRYIQSRSLRTDKCKRCRFGERERKNSRAPH